MQSALSPETWPFSLDWLPPTTCLVGGNVRDALLGRKAEYLDLDFVLAEGAVAVAEAIARHYKTGYVLLDQERQIARVVFDRATVDFAQQVGDCLEEDLHRRDFTVNAIAYHPHSDRLIDPLSGYTDLQHQRIRMVAPENLKEDPLRLLRAYRQAAQLGFSLEPETQATIQDLAPLLERIAPERVQAELNYLLGTPKGTSFLKMAWQDQLLAYWLPHATHDSMEYIAGIDRAMILLEQLWPALAEEATSWPKDQQKASGMGRSWLRVAKLVCLTEPILDIAEQDLWRLKYSRLEVQAAMTVVRTLPLLATLTGTASAGQQYRFFQSVGSTFPALVLVAAAQGLDLETIAPLLNHYLDPTDPVAHPQALISGRDLMKALNLRPSPQIGKLLDAIHLAHAEGAIANREDAITWARRYAEEGILLPPSADTI
ncbi:CCA tRNA nucleotidyltransferase [Leptolyngbya sp. FACHB-16]|nr:CCA tRNA nucleotidyltransferase [Leptolyngbya sp. FACHB-8]MBD2155092.1 CCA tRNA nucleotidyltransferase [Leptolyngbya sp. FACHB-16]